MPLLQRRFPWFLRQVSFRRRPGLGFCSRTEVKLYAHFAVREDAQVLYGFFSRAERDIFRSLIGVSGVGGNTARMILSSFTAEEVCTIVATGQADVLKTVKGLGLKTAQKIIVELRDKIGAGSAAATSVPVQGAVGETFSEAVAALTMLGFTRQATEKALRAIYFCCQIRGICLCFLTVMVCFLGFSAESPGAVT